MILKGPHECPQGDFMKGLEGFKWLNPAVSCEVL